MVVNMWRWWWGKEFYLFVLFTELCALVVLLLQIPSHGGFGIQQTNLVFISRFMHTVFPMFCYILLNHIVNFRYQSCQKLFCCVFVEFYVYVCIYRHTAWSVFGFFLLYYIVKNKINFSVYLPCHICQLTQDFCFNDENIFTTFKITNFCDILIFVLFSASTVANIWKCHKFLASYWFILVIKLSRV